MTAPDEPETAEPFDANSAQAREAALERLTMDYPVEFDRLPDALRTGDPEDSG